MSYSRSDEYASQSVRVAGEARLLSHPARIKILLQLQNEALTLREIAIDHPLALPSVFHHLRELINFGLVETDGDTSVALYWTDASTWSRTIRFLVKECSGEVSSWRAAA